MRPGAANTAANVSSLGAQVPFLSGVGADPEADLLPQVLGKSRVSTEYLLIRPARRTLAKSRPHAGEESHEGWNADGGAR